MSYYITIGSTIIIITDGASVVVDTICLNLLEKGINKNE